MPLTVTHRSLPNLHRPWRKGVAVGRAYELLRADVQEHLALCRRKIGFEYCRFHGLFHDDMLVALRDPEGALHFQWNQVDKIIDFLLSIGMKPFAQLGPMPGALASGSTTFFWWKMNVTPPRDFAEWEALVQAFVRHCVRRYGIEEVRTWYFEVWNEPNLRAFWDGTWEQYLELYARSAAAVKSVDPNLKIGGPASAEAKKIPEFLAECAQRGIPVDFVSTHVYPQNEWNHYEGESPHAPGEFYGDTLRRVRNEAGQTPLFWTEWNALSARTRDDVDWTDNTSIDRLEAAAFTVRACIELDDQSDGLFWWVASDVFEEAGIAQSPFSSTYGLLTIDGIPKASFRAFEMLAELKGERVEVVSDLHPKAPSSFSGENEEGVGVTAFRDGEILRLLLWNDASVADPQTWEDSILVEADSPQTLTRRQIRKGKGSAYESWIEVGRPHEITPLQKQALLAASEPQTSMLTLEPTDGKVTISFRLEPGEVALFEVAPASETAHNR
ncbi:MAG TPA: hypothetical protein PLX06_12470, partial [Fimbriimonadaceae bacterium]|nr:hypothetical protein [Fimbriimonadaceae bacterium]